MEAIAHTSATPQSNGGDHPVAIVVAWRCAVQNTKRGYLSSIAGELDDFVSVFRFSSVSIVHRI